MLASGASPDPSPVGPADPAPAQGLRPGSSGLTWAPRPTPQQEPPACADVGPAFQVTRSLSWEVPVGSLFP